MIGSLDCNLMVDTLGRKTSRSKIIMDASFICVLDVQVNFTIHHNFVSISTT